MTWLIAWFRRIDELVADAPISLLMLSAVAVGAGLVVVFVMLWSLFYRMGGAIGKI
jgi:hypothetical protein